MLWLLNFASHLINIERECCSKGKEVKFITILADFRDRNSIENIFKEYKPEMIIHASAYTHVPIQEIYPWEAVNTNIKCSLNLINLADEYNVESLPAIVINNKKVIYSLTEVSELRDILK